MSQNPYIKQAFQAVKREDFLPDDVKQEAYVDAPLPIGYGQTNSQPWTVRKMLEWLDPQPGEHILDVGSGSGWTSALLASIVGSKGRVYAVEKIPQLVEFGRHNCAAYTNLRNIAFFEAGSSIGLPEKAPFDRILVSASAQKLPDDLITQLKPTGRMVIPVQSDILVITLGSGVPQVTKHPGFMFVPLIT